ncbi:Bel2 [Equine foamy virus]|uniref:Bel2 n=1 Tax=equine foamy virus Equus caballus TaxID=2849477 RepID=Q9J4C4_9RETR|nr:Bel2 [Equine foamy virus]AAF64417.1 Bel2 [equine foamy virus Equus caballus]
MRNPGLGCLTWTGQLNGMGRFQIQLFRNLTLISVCLGSDHHKGITDYCCGPASCYTIVWEISAEVLATGTPYLFRAQPHHRPLQTPAPWSKRLIRTRYIRNSVEDQFVHFATEANYTPLSAQALSIKAIRWHKGQLACEGTPRIGQAGIPETIYAGIKAYGWFIPGKKERVSWNEDPETKNIAIPSSTEVQEWFPMEDVDDRAREPLDGSETHQEIAEFACAMLPPGWCIVRPEGRTYISTGPDTSDEEEDKALAPKILKTHPSICPKHPRHHKIGGRFVSDLLDSPSSSDDEEEARQNLARVLEAALPHPGEDSSDDDPLYLGEPERD